MPGVPDVPHTPGQRRTRAQIAAHTSHRAAHTAHRDACLRAAAWKKVALILTVIAAVLGVIAAVLNLATAALHALPTSSSGTRVVVIYAPPRGLRYTKAPACSVTARASRHQGRRPTAPHPRGTR
jgi:hypothetical protein